MDIPARDARSGDSPPVVSYENPLPSRASTARRVLIATWCGAIPPLLLASLCVGAMVTHNERLFVLAMIALLPAHVVVAFGVFLLCMEYGEARMRTTPIGRFLQRCSLPIGLLLLNGPVFIGVMLLGLSIR